MALAVVPLNFNAFLEKAKLKDDGSNYMDWVHNLRIILIAAQKNYVLEAPPGVPPAPTTADIVNAWQTRVDDYSIVQCAILYGLESGLQRHFERHGAYEMRYMKSPTSSIAAKWRRIVLSVNTYSECLDTITT